MREHKFRAWHPRNEAFEYWTLSDFWRNGWICCSHTEPIVSCSFPSDTYGAFAVLADWEEYTGLKDKNGRECYEGDIVSRSKSKARIGVIQFAQGAFGINWDYATNSDPEWIDGTMYGSWGSLSNLRDINDGFITRCLEIIGNIHENAALLDHNPGPSAE